MRNNIFLCSWCFWRLPSSSITCSPWSLLLGGWLFVQCSAILPHVTSPEGGIESPSRVKQIKSCCSLSDFTGWMRNSSDELNMSHYDSLYRKATTLRLYNQNIDCSSIEISRRDEISKSRSTIFLPYQTLGKESDSRYQGLTGQYFFQIISILSQNHRFSTGSLFHFNPSDFKA